jgi:hypothetical protein
MNDALRKARRTQGRLWQGPPISLPRPHRAAAPVGQVGCRDHQALRRGGGARSADILGPLLASGLFSGSTPERSASLAQAHWTATHRAPPGRTARGVCRMLVRLTGPAASRRPGTPTRCRAAMSSGTPTGRRSHYYDTKPKHGRPERAVTGTSVET